MKSSLRRPFLLLSVVASTTIVVTAEFHSLRASRRRQQQDDDNNIAHSKRALLIEDDGNDQQQWPTYLTSTHEDESIISYQRQLQHGDESSTSPEDYTLSISPNSHRVLCYGDGLTQGIQANNLARIPYGPILQYYLQQEEVFNKQTTVHVAFVGRDRLAAEDMRKAVHGDFGLLPHVRRVGSQVVILWAGMIDIVVRKHEKDVDLRKDVLHDITHLHEMAWLELDVRYTIAVAIPVPPKATEDQAQIIQDVNAALEEWAAQHTNRVRFVPLPEESQKWASNHLHLTATGYEEVAKALKPVVLDLLRKPYRVFIYGDSITHGTVVGDDSSGTGPFPYRHFMEKELAKTIPNVIATDMGLPGRRAISSLEMLDSPPFGLLCAIEQAGGKAPSAFPEEKQQATELVDLVIILLGSSDLTLEVTDYPLLTALMGLHQAATGQAKVRHTVSIGIPPSRLQQEDPAKGELATLVNDWFSKVPSLQVSPMAFPFGYDENDDDNDLLWSRDGFHPNREGYQVLGESLAPLVASRLLGYQKRVFCFGDAYTSGTTKDGKPHPYANILHQRWKDVAVSHMGSFHRKKTAVEMEDELDKEHGLAFLLKHTGTVMDAVVITAGTLDVLAQDSTKAATIFESIRSLHQTALEHDAKHTFVIGIPLAVFNDSSKWVRDKVKGVNQRLRTYASNHNKVTFVDWPILTTPTEDEGDGDDPSFWSADGLHLSREGYDEFASKLGPIIRSVL